MKSISLGTYRINDNYKHHLVELDDPDTNEAARVAATIQCSFERDGYGLRSLRQVLINLKHCKLRVGLGVHDDLINSRRLQPGGPRPQDPEWSPIVRRIVRRAYGFEQLYGQLDLSRVGRREADGTLLDLCSASIQSGYDLSALSLDFDNILFGENGGAWGAAILDPLVMASVFPNGSTTPVIDFTIKLCEDCIEDDSILRLRSDRSMEITRHGISDDPVKTPDLCSLPYGLFTVALYQDRFAKIVLKDCSVDKTLTDEFLRSRSSTLRHLELLCLYRWGHDDDDEGGVLEFWQALETMSSLEVLVLENFAFENMSRNVHFDGRVILRGAEIRVGLSKANRKD